MKKIGIALFLCLLAIAIATYLFSSRSFASVHFTRSNSAPDGSTYTFDLIIDKGEEYPRWYYDKADQPPLSPAKAARLAEGFMEKVSTAPLMEKWRLRTITLQSLGSEQGLWCYVVNFVSIPDKGSGVPAPVFDVVVKMDGTIPKPSLTKEKNLLTTQSS